MICFELDLLRVWHQLFSSRYFYIICFVVFEEIYVFGFGAPEFFVFDFAF